MPEGNHFLFINMIFIWTHHYSWSKGQCVIYWFQRKFCSSNCCVNIVFWFVPSVWYLSYVVCLGLALTIISSVTDSCLMLLFTYLWYIQCKRVMIYFNVEICLIRINLDRNMVIDRILWWKLIHVVDST